MTPEIAMRNYYDLRGKLDEQETAHAVACAPLKEKIKLLMTYMEAYTVQNGLRNLPVEGFGTGYFSEISSASVADSGALRAFMAENDMWHMLENRVSSKAVKEYMESTNQPVPGVSFSQIRVFKVRASNNKE